ncbi:TAXI family TRAP transporter solute-binding subunit [Rhizobium sp. L1K21]|uniref:TAXI family TRAP transporter solute-binding subunit n=1 Tax=Rhizobium sp. L1K21 TaxID=2954933 RepID=UPI00209378D8|nr:TAXI family TRAP transporter solute-binding subunit [Rhizobium sp. L1K21]
MKKSFVAALAVGLAIAGGPALALDRLTIGTGPSGALYNQIGTTLSALFQKETGKPGTAQPFTGTTSYMPMVHLGEIEAGILGGLESSDAYLGKGNYPQAMDNIRALMVVSRPAFQFFARASDGMTSVADLAGKTVVTRYKALAGFDQVIMAGLATAGLTEKDVKAVEMGGIVEAIDAVQDGRIDSAMVALGIVPLRQADASISGGVRMLTLGDNLDVVDEVPDLQAVDIEPSPAQIGVPEPIKALSFNTFLDVGASMSDDDAYNLVKVIYTHWADAQAALPALKGMKQEWMVPPRLAFPFHPGAIRFFKEVGLWTPEHDAQQAAFLN